MVLLTLDSAVQYFNIAGKLIDCELTTGFLVEERREAG
jgi:hypothetical protein